MSRRALVTGAGGFVGTRFTRFLESRGFPIAPMILGMLLGTMLEEHFIRSMIKADGNMMAFVERPIAGGLALFIFALWIGSAWVALRKWSRAVSSHKKTGGSMGSGDVWYGLAAFMARRAVRRCACEHSVNRWPKVRSTASPCWPRNSCPSRPGPITGRWPSMLCGTPGRKM